MKLKLRISDQLRNDLIEIWCFIAEDNVNAADKLVDSITDTLSMLLSLPRSGRLRYDIREDIRSYSIGNYVIFYRLTITHLEVLRVLHGSRDIKAILSAEQPETFRFEDE